VTVGVADSEQSFGFALFLSRVFPSEGKQEQNPAVPG